MQYAGREPLGDDIADAHHVLGDLQAFGVPDVQRDAALAGILVVELAAHVGVAHAGQRAGRRIARRAAADRRHRRQPRVGIVLPFDLEALRTHRGEKPRAAGGGKKPREIEDLDSLQREGLVVQGGEARGLDAARLRRHARAADAFAEHRRGIFAEQWRAAADLPAGLVAEPFAGRIAEAAAQLRVLDIGEGVAGEPMLVERILVRLAQWRPEEARILRLAPRHVLIGPGAHKTLHDVEHMRPRLITAGGAGHLTRAQIGIRRRRLQIGLGAVFRQQRHEVLQVARAHTMGDEPAPVLRVANARRMIGKFGGVPVGQPPQRHPPHHPVHDVLLGVLRHRLVDRHRDILTFAAALAMDQRGDDPGSQLLAGDVISMPDLRRDRRRIVFEVWVGVVTAIHHDAAEREVDQVGAFEVHPRPVIPERRHPCGHQLREADVEGGAIETQRLVQRAAAGVE